MDTNADVIDIAEKIDDIINTRINAERDAATVIITRIRVNEVKASA